MLTLFQFGLLSTMVGIVCSLLLSLGVAGVYRRPFFLYWTGGYLLAALSLTLLTLGRLGPGGPPILIAGVVGLAGYGLLVVKSAAALKQRPLPRGWLGGAVALAGSGAAMVLAGTPWGWLHLLLALWSSATYAWLGVTLLRLEAPAAGPTRPALGGLLIGLAVWVWSALALEPTPHLWLAFVVAGVLQLFIGLAMVVFLLELQVGELKAINAELKQLDARKTDFIATVNHELRTPLAVIQGTSDLLEDGLVGPLTPEQGRLVGTINRQVAHLGSLIHDMLDFSNLHFAQRPPELVPEELASLAAAVAEGFAGPYEEKGVRLDLRVEGEPPPCQLDRAQIMRVLINLLGNALKYTPAGGRVAISLRRDGEAALLSVTDTGSGIAPEDLEPIFTRFYQAEGAAEGSGLGLAICRGIVEDNHQGRIWAESEPGCGATFHVRLPLKPPRPQPSPLSLSS